MNSTSRDKWEAIGAHKKAGVLVPLFCVYSRKSLGIGDFSALRLLIDWACQTGNSIIQLLPMNEVGFSFCPYDSLSSFALEPVYISLDLLPGADNKTIQAKIRDLRIAFPVGRRYVNYAIKKEKLKLLWEIFLQWDHSDSLELKKFREQNIYWLQDFALYKVLKDYHKGGAWYEWEIEFKTRDQAALGDFQLRYAKEITFQHWMQWHLYKQFKTAKEYARAKEVLLKGDLPILVSRDSADVWAHPEFFKLEYVAGAPPDMYCAKGQRWGMPIYNWQPIEALEFNYLKEKLRYAENFYDILRIDHMVGLFRIWSIPYNEPLENIGLNGFFDPPDEREWAGQGRKLLTVILNNTDMLFCAEDLGVIPRVCTDTLKDLNIPGNDVQRWVKDWKTNHDFRKPEEYRGLSVAMLSTHDTTNWPAWWENEAGTIDEALFIRKCSDQRRINFSAIKNKLFNLRLSRHGRLRWLDSIDSVEKLVAILGEAVGPKGAIPKEHLLDFIDLYENTYREREKLWRHLKLSGPMREKSDAEIVRAAIEITLQSNAVFCINTIIDLLYLSDIPKGDAYQYRINTPGTISDKNWSLTIPISLEELLKHKVSKVIRNLLQSYERISAPV